MSSLPLPSGFKTNMQTSFLQHVDDETRQVLDRFYPGAASVRIDDRLIDALTDGYAPEVLKMHEEGLLHEIESRMDLLRRMRTLESLNSAFNALTRRGSVHLENIRCKGELTETLKHMAELNDKVNLYAERIKQLEMHAEFLRHDRQRLREEVKAVNADLSKERRMHEDTRIELGIATAEAERKSDVRQPAPEVPRMDALYHADLMKLATFCCEATQNWLQQTEENNWAARVIHRLSTSLARTQEKLWDVVVGVAENFGHVTWLDKLERRRFNEVKDLKCAESGDSIVLWGNQINRADVINHQEISVHFRARSFTSLSSFLVNFQDYVIDGSTDSEEVADVLQSQRLRYDELVGISPTPQGGSVVTAMLQPLRKAMRRWEENRPFYTDVFVENGNRWNMLDSLAYQTTGERGDVVSAWLVHLLSSAAMAVHGRTVYFTPIALLYTYQGANSSVPSTFSHYRVGLSLTHINGGATHTHSAWLPLSFLSFEIVLHMVDYLSDHITEGGNLQVMIRGKEISNDVKLKRMRGPDVVRDPVFGEERVLTFPTDEWLSEACVLYTTMPHKDISLLTESEDGSKGWLQICPMLSPRCDNFVIGTVGLSNFTYNGASVLTATTGNGASVKGHVTNAHVRYMYKKYVAGSKLVSKDDLHWLARHLF